MLKHHRREFLISFAFGLFIATTGCNKPAPKGITRKLTFEIDEELALARGIDLDKIAIEDLVSQVQSKLQRLIDIGHKITDADVYAGPKEGQIVVMHSSAIPIENLLTQNYFLEFAILANQTDHASIIATADALPPEETVVKSEGETIAIWAPVAVDDAGQDRVRKDASAYTRTISTEDGQRTEFLVIVDPDWNRRLTSQDIIDVSVMEDSGRRSLQFQLNERGAFRMGQLTSRNLPAPRIGLRRRLAVLLNGELMSAPMIGAVITQTGVVDGVFSDNEIEEGARILNSGSMAIPIRLVKE